MHADIKIAHDDGGIGDNVLHVGQLGSAVHRFSDKLYIGTPFNT